MLDAILTASNSDYISLLEEIFATCAAFFAGGALIAIIAWAIGYAVYTVYHWLTSWTVPE